MADGSRQARVIEVGALEGYHLVEHLLVKHWEEIARFKEISAIKPDLVRYQGIEDDGRFLGLVAMFGDEVVGYSANVFAYNMHYSDLHFCQNDVLYVVPEFRLGRLGLSLIRETVRLAKQRGAHLMLWHAKDDTPLNALLPRLGYEILDVIWAKRL